MGGQVVLEKTVGEVLWLFHFDLIHHRGQLTTYLRPMGSKVPSIYGKSGDASAELKSSHAKSQQCSNGKKEAKL